ncbi:ferrous iron transporter B [Clostridiisalibacter paucivorans]|uniref:ferrous iron transporter B n=1 Tax=Clostridiisalibacter paucivorans TaxID=408753 RepID=UPI00047C9329|nr:ferrous iron transporter B [Clostridiisalibacter paucivorans]
MSCHKSKHKEISVDGKTKILLMGNPNVGKSVIFSKLTGVNVDSSNYTGTTVDYTIGDFNFRNEKGVIIDVPGTYSLEATSEAEKVAVSLLEENADVIICVLDATHLDRNLDLAFQLKEYSTPIIYCLNLIDVAERQGIKIDSDKLSEELNAPVIPTVAIKNIGLMDLLTTSMDLKDKETTPVPKMEENLRWKKINEVINKVQTNTEKKPSFVDKLEHWTVKPWPGIPISVLILIISLGVVIGGGKALRAVILLPLLNKVTIPFLTTIVSMIIPAGIFRNLLVGEYGMLIIGIEWPFALILPYVLLFYIVFSFLEDSGYLPRIGVLADGILRKIGIQGGNIIPLMMGYGCAVPSIISTRAANTYKERIMVASLVSLAIPCVSQTGAFIALLGDRSPLALVMVYITSLIVILIAGIVMNKVIPGRSQPMLLEVPNLLWPDRTAFFKKLKLRMKHFFIEARGAMMIGIAIAAIIVETGMLQGFSNMVSPLVEEWLGLPREASLFLILGIVRREFAALPLLELDLSVFQLFVGSIVALFYLPCISVFGILIKEFSLKSALMIGVGTTLVAFLLGGSIKQIGNLVISLF